MIECTSELATQKIQLFVRGGVNKPEIQLGEVRTYTGMAWVT